MPNRLRHSVPGFSHKMLDASTSTGPGTEFDLQSPLKDWSLQVVTGSTDAIATLDLSNQSSSGAVFESKLTWATTGGQASGDMVHLSTTVARQARVTNAAGASSNGMSAWVAGM